MKTALITGASSGIGRATTEEFLQRGYRVVGAVLDPSHVQDLQNKFPQNFLIWKCDFLNLSEVGTITAFLQKNSITQIDILVNNAGVALTGPFEIQDFSEVEKTITVNVLAMMKLTQLIIPFLIPARGRIINISSISGVAVVPFLGVYAVSKHAIEAISHALKMELNIHGISVSVIGPGSVRTPIWSKGINRTQLAYENSIYKNAFHRFLQFVQDEEKNSLPVEAVVKDILHAAESSRPKTRYAPVPRLFRNWFLPNFVPKAIMTSLKIKAFGLSIKEN